MALALSLALSTQDKQALSFHNKRSNGRRLCVDINGHWHTVKDIMYPWMSRVYIWGLMSRGHTSGDWCRGIRSVKVSHDWMKTNGVCGRPKTEHQQIIKKEECGWCYPVYLERVRVCIEACTGSRRREVCILSQCQPTKPNKIRTKSRSGDVHFTWKVWKLCDGCPEVHFVNDKIKTMYVCIDNLVVSLCIVTLTFK